MARRVGLYFVGILLGVLMVFVFFGERTSVLSAWLPQPRMRTEILEKTKQEAFPDCFAESKLGEDYVGFVSFINDAHIDFSTMKRENESRIYNVHQSKGSDNFLTVELTDSTCTLLAIQKEGQEFLCQ
tara:strand:- start:177672 stop:178055 length:384 start_codon:yes stop_codon:yes gene_type:complete